MYMGSVLCSHPLYNFALSFSSWKLSLEKVLTQVYAHAWKHMFSCLTFWIYERERERERERSKWENFSLYSCNKMQVWLTVVSSHIRGCSVPVDSRTLELVFFLCALNSWFYQFVKNLQQIWGLGRCSCSMINLSILNFINLEVIVKICLCMFLLSCPFFWVSSFGVRVMSTFLIVEHVILVQAFTV
jgi:hypothetical protein